MSDAQDDLKEAQDELAGLIFQCARYERPSMDWKEALAEYTELCRAHFQRQAEPVAESTKTNLINESGGYWVDGEFRIEGKDLDAMLDRLYTSPPIPADMVMVSREKLKPIARWHRKIHLELSGAGSGWAAQQMYLCPHGKFADELEAMIAPAPKEGA